jgi:DNA invertase Pin-like site-specific DNA recombinase
MSAIVIGYARCFAERRDLTAQRKALRQLGVAKERIYVDRGLAGNPPRPGLEKVLAAVGRGDTLVVPRLGRLARSLRDARAIGEQLAARGVKLSLGGVVYDPEDPASSCLFEVLATFAEFEVDLLRLRTREGMAVARANGKLKGKQPKLTARQHAQLLELHNTGQRTISQLAERLSVSRATIYRALDRAAAEAA